MLNINAYALLAVYYFTMYYVSHNHISSINFEHALNFEYWLVN